MGVGRLSRFLRDEEDPTIQEEKGEGRLSAEEEQRALQSAESLSSHRLCAIRRASPIPWPGEPFLPSQHACCSLVYGLLQHFICFPRLAASPYAGLYCPQMLPVVQPVSPTSFVTPLRTEGVRPGTPHHVCHGAGAELTWAALK